ncbi:CarD family transcriptional regulator [Lentibacillus sp. CBA3610]|uniref:CarD family transcriptional regulator n=1 Tax=Lentibacillus sp. CBA3610 TaxID=2518176 RepID=UPI0015993F00|nr:CarD family transcriptional regulator [Lentibacillus sp. CBA3610]QKY68282.1 CarD family transcriptional regulator [Lentibacillus sp. CBA3610]
MHDIGDLIIYSGHGICRVEDISDKEVNGAVKTYYVLHPIEDNQHQLTINAPAENKNVMMRKLMNKDEAKKILESFQSKGVDWIDNSNSRIKTYNAALNSGDRMEIAKTANTLIRKKHVYQAEGRKFFEQDSKLLTNIQTILFKELSIVLETSTDDIKQEIIRIYFIVHNTRKVKPPDWAALLFWVISIVILSKRAIDR